MYKIPLQRQILERVNAGGKKCVSHFCLLLALVMHAVEVKRLWYCRRRGEGGGEGGGGRREE